ncbi:MAG: DNRLRE domain-containing protein [Planctomycetota bacterium]
MQQVLSLTLAFACTALGPVLPVGAEVIAFSSKDTYVDRDAPDTAFGADPLLRVRQANDFFVSFVSFGLGTLSADIGSADLELFKQSGRGDRSPTVFGITDESFDSWSEASLTWNSLGLGPTDTGAALPITETALGTLFTSGSRIDGQTSVILNAADGSNNIQSPIDQAALVAFLNSDTNGIVTFAIHHPNTNGNTYLYHSRENSSGNTPELRFTVVPEPGSVGLLCMGGLVMLRWRRHHRSDHASSVRGEGR